MVSALHASKRVREGIRCAARVPQLHLVVAGEGPLRREIEELGRSLMGRRFTRIAVARERMPALYRAADVFLHMSIDEPSANAYMEAMATGLPIVTHDRSVTRWTLAGTAVLVDTTDESAVVEGIRCGLELAGNAQVAARRDLVQRRFCWRHIAGEYRAFFERVLEQRA